MDELRADRLNICLSKPRPSRHPHGKPLNICLEKKAPIAEVNTADRMIDGKAFGQQSWASLVGVGMGAVWRGAQTIYCTPKKGNEWGCWVGHSMTSWEIKDVNPTRSIIQHNPPTVYQRGTCAAWRCGRLQSCEDCLPRPQRFFKGVTADLCSFWRMKPHIFMACQHPSHLCLSNPQFPSPPHRLHLTGCSPNRPMGAWGDISKAQFTLINTCSATAIFGGGGGGEENDR